jgi:hypothetical protein
MYQCCRKKTRGQKPRVFTARLIQETLETMLQLTSRLRYWTLQPYLPLVLPSPPATAFICVRFSHWLNLHDAGDAHSAGADGVVGKVCVVTHVVADTLDTEREEGEQGARFRANKKAWLLLDAAARAFPSTAWLHMYIFVWTLRPDPWTMPSTYSSR